MRALLDLLLSHSQSQRPHLLSFASVFLSLMLAFTVTISLILTLSLIRSLAACSGDCVLRRVIV